jgi:Mg2+ and Co2+ transporter CorA
MADLTARMSAEQPNDLALSVTHVPKQNSTFAVIYGCNNRQMEKLEKRIRSAGFAVQHPLLIVGIFAELERERLVGLSDDLVDNFTLKSDILESACWNPESDMGSEKSQQHLSLCIRSRILIDHIRAVKRQLRKLLDHVDETDSWLLQARSVSKEESQRVIRMEKVGHQIRKRIREIMDEYDDKIDECSMMSENLSLTMQTLWNQIARHDSKTNTQIAQVNTVIALETKRDNIQMRSIALLTMVFIPLSCVASVFSTDLFDFQAADGKVVVSKYVWVFVVVSVALTAVTVLAWHFGTNRDIKKEKRSNSWQMKELGIV